MTESLRLCHCCRAQSLAPSWTVCPRCGAAVSIEATLLDTRVVVRHTADPEVQARHPEMTPRAALAKERRIARHLELVYAAWLVLERAGVTWERVTDYIRRRERGG